MIKPKIRFPASQPKEETPLASKKIPEKGDWNYYETWQEEHSKSFVVAKMASADLLQDVHKSLVKAEADGQPFQEWKKEIEPILEKKGWLGKDVVNPDTGEIAHIKPQRLETIYRTNMVTSTAAARYKRQMDLAEDFPYWKYVTAGDERVREEHRALNGKIFEATDPFWNTHYPPNGWRCRCQTEILDEGDIKDNNLKVERGLGKVSFEEQEITKGVTKTVALYKDKEIVVKTEPGWSYNPGLASTIDQVAWEKAKTYPAELKTQFLVELSKNKYKEPLYQKWLDKNLQKAEKFIKENNKKYAPNGDNFVIGVLKEAAVNKLKEAGIDIKSPYLAINDHKIMHSLREVKTRRGQAVNPEDFKKLCNLVNNEEAYIDKKNNSIVYFLKDKGFNEQEKEKKQISKFVFKFSEKYKNYNLLVTAGKTSLADIKGWKSLESL